MAVTGAKLRERVQIYEKIRQPNSQGEMIQVSQRLKSESLAHITQAGARERADGQLWDNPERWIVETWFNPDIKRDDLMYIPEYNVWVEIDIVLYSKPFMRLEGISRT